MRPKDTKGRYIKIHSDLFGYKTPPLTNSRDRNTGKEIESNNTQKLVELGTRPEGTEVTLSGDSTDPTSFTNKGRFQFG